jgi:hypothetical protein
VFAKTRRRLTSGEEAASASTTGDNVPVLADSGGTPGDFVTNSDWGEDMGESVGGYSGSSLFKQEEEKSAAS